MTTPFSRFADGQPVGDVIPFYDEGAYHLFILTPAPGTLHFPQRLRTTWRHLRSTDLRQWEELPAALTPGEPGSPDDDGIWTGSVIRDDEQYHIFYTGHSLDSVGPRQSICHATSLDGVRWTKDPANPLLEPDSQRFERKDFRDPFVFWNAAEGCYWMLISARSALNPAVSRGVVAFSTSPDLRTWTAAEPMHEAFLTHCPECPEVFRLGEEWILAYSRFTDRRGTVFRHGTGPRGPWHAFPRESLDGANWYAAKSLTDGAGRRIAFGWIPERNPEPGAGFGAFLWGGDLATPRELFAAPDGQIGLRPAPGLLDDGRPAITYRPQELSVGWKGEEDGSLSLAAEAPGRFSSCLLVPTEPVESYTLSLTVRARAATVGVAVQTGEGLDSGMAVLCYPAEGRMRAIDLAAAQSDDDGEYELPTTEYAPFVESRLGSTSADSMAMRIVVRGDMVEAFVDGTCFSYRLPASGTGQVALLVDDGSATFGNVLGRLLG